MSSPSLNALETTAGTGAEPRRERLLAAVAGGHSPAGGPLLGRAEIDVLRGGDGPVREAVLRGRLAEWRIRDAAGAEAEPARAAAAAVADELDALAATFAEGGQFPESRTVLGVSGALRRAIATAEGRTLERLSADSDPAQPAAAQPSPGEFARRQAAAAKERRRRLLLVGSLPVALVLAWLVYPRPLPSAPPLPEAPALAPELELSEVTRVGEVVIARSSRWSSLAEPDRATAAAAACGRTLAAGFRGLVLRDESRTVVFTCPGSPARR